MYKLTFLFLLTALISLGVFGLSVGLSAAFKLWGIENAICASVFYYTTSYIAPIAFLVSFFGSQVCAIKSGLMPLLVGDYEGAYPKPLDGAAPSLEVTK